MIHIVVAYDALAIVVLSIVFDAATLAAEVSWVFVVLVVFHIYTCRCIAFDADGYSEYLQEE